MITLARGGSFKVQILLNTIVYVAEKLVFLSYKDSCDTRRTDNIECQKLCKKILGVCSFEDLPYQTCGPLSSSLPDDSLAKTSPLA